MSRQRHGIEIRAKAACWYEVTKSYVAVRRQLLKEYGKNFPVPSNARIKDWHENLFERGDVRDTKKQRTSTVRTEENVERVLGHFSDNPHTSERRASNTLHLSRSTIKRILKDLKWHPYKVQIVQKLYEEDYASRLFFAQNELNRLDNDDARLFRLAFSDEANFHMDGMVNRHNCRYWAPENPNWVIEQGLHSEKVGV